MRKLVYHVAVSVDNFIARADHSIDGFIGEGEHVTDYLNQLKDYDTVVMGRATYEFGYRFGLKPGAAPYPHMEHYIFSNTLHFDHHDKNVHIVRSAPFAFIKNLKEQSGSAIYLCGGGMFAGSLLDLGLIDKVVLKVSPAFFVDGIPLFGACKKPVKLSLKNCIRYPAGVLLLGLRRPLLKGMH